MPWTRTRPAATALGVVLPMYIPFCGIAVFRNVRKPAWLSGFLDTLFPTVLQSDRPKKQPQGCSMERREVIALRQRALTASDRASLHWQLQMSPAKADSKIFSLP